LLKETCNLYSHTFRALRLKRVHNRVKISQEPNLTSPYLMFQWSHPMFQLPYLFQFLPQSHLPWQSHRQLNEMAKMSINTLNQCKTVLIIVRIVQLEGTCYNYMKYVLIPFQSPKKQQKSKKNLKIYTSREIKIQISNIKQWTNI